MNKLQAIQKKKLVIQRHLDKWIRTSGLFSAGEALRFTLDLVLVPTVITTSSESSSSDSLEIVTPCIRETSYYRYITTDISPEEWEKILRITIPETYRECLQKLRDNNNSPIPLKQFDCTNFGPINKRLRDSKLKFLIKIVYSFETNSVVQLFRVEPKSRVKKYYQ